jgi:hypothetical protein
MPWLDLISVEIESALIALIPAIEVGIFLHPSDVSTIFLIGQIVTLSRRIEHIDRESKLMFAMSWWSTEWVTTLSEIPETLLIVSTPISTDHSDRLAPFLLEFATHIIEGS